MSVKLDQWWQQCLITADQAATHAKNVLGWRSSHSKPKPPLCLSSLEPRILFSATPIDPAMVQGGDETAMVVEVDAEASDEEGAASLESFAEASLTQQVAEIIIIDSQTPGLEQLLDDLAAAGRDGEVFVLDADRDGVDEMTSILESRSDVGSIHVISHAENGRVKLGNVWLGESNLDGYAGQIASWQAALGSDADILFYGCDLAASSSGQELLRSISALTEADVAASTDDTGHADHGGDWTLEFEIGSIDSTIAFSESLQESWRLKLSTITVDTFDDIIDAGDGLTSLREAVIAANAGSGGDTIVLAAGTYTLSIGLPGESSALQGDLDITNEITIIGAGADETIIDADGIDRVFELRTGSAALTVSDLTIQGGSVADKGGGIYVNNGGSILTMERVVVSGNSATDGAGIFNGGTMTLTDVWIEGNGDLNLTITGGGIANHQVAILDRVTVSGNRAVRGGGIENAVPATLLSLTNVTISGNSAATSGGGLFNSSSAEITNATIVRNFADSGGGITRNGGSVTLRNTIVAANTASSSPDVQNSFTSQGNNLIGDRTGSTGLIDGVNDDQVGNSVGVLDPMIDLTLRDQGGFVPTHALLAGSAAVDSGQGSGAPAIDARGIDRWDGQIDIGAYEAAFLSKIYWSDSGSGKIQSADLDGGNVQDIVTGLSGVGRIGLEIDSQSGKIYWSEEANNVIRRANLDGSGIEDIVSGIQNIREIAVDAASGHIYWSEDGFASNKIRRANLDGSGVVDLINSGLSDPGGLELDLEGGKIYWVDTSAKKIQRADLDGNNIQDLVTSVDGLEGPRRLKLDLAGGKMYWTDDGFGVNLILRANLDGSVIEDLVSTGLGAPVAIDLDTQAGKIYWTDVDTDKIQVSDLDGSNVEDLIVDGLTIPAGLSLGPAGVGVINPPSDIHPDSISLNEHTDTSSGFSLAVLTASDADGAGETFSWSIAGGVDQSKFSIGGSNDNELILTDGILDHESQASYAVLVRVTDSQGNVYEETIDVDVIDQNDSPAGSPTISGTAREDETLTAETSGISDDDGLGAFDYQWLRDGTAISGATSRTYLLGDDDVDHAISVEVTYVDGHGKLEGPLTSAQTAAVVNVNDSPVADSETFVMTAGNSLTVAAPGVLLGDTDADGDVLTALVFINPIHGDLSLAADGSLVYKPDAGFTGTDAFSYQAHDGLTSSAPAVVTIIINAAAVPLPLAPIPIDPGSPGDPEPEPTDDAPEEPTDDEPDEDDDDGDNGSDGAVPTGNGPTNTPPAPRAPVVVVPGGTTSDGTSSESESGPPLASQAQGQAGGGDDTERYRQTIGALIDASPRISRSPLDQLTMSPVQVNYALMVGPGLMWNELDQSLEEVDSRIHGDLIVVGTAGAAASSFTVVVVAWALRAGFLASGLLAQMPAWRAVDPMLIMQGFGDDQGDQESLEQLMEHQSQSLDESETDAEPGDDA